MQLLSSISCHPGTKHTVHLLLPRFLTQSVLSTPTPLFYQSSLLLFLTCKSLPRSTVWSQHMITLIILIIEPGPYSQCTCIVFHKYSAAEVIFYSIPKPHCLHLHESHAFMSWASRPFQSFSFLTDPLPQLISSQGLAFQFSLFLTKLSFLTLSSMQRMPHFIKSNYLIFFLFYKLHVTKYRNNVSEWE